MWRLARGVTLAVTGSIGMVRVLHKIVVWFILVLAAVVLAGQYFDIMLKPGGMLSDITPGDLQNFQHQEVVNLRQNKLGEWETVRGFVVVDTGFGNIKAGCEVTDDITGERFLLVQDGKYLVRVDWDDDDGYMGAAHDTLDLPWVDVLKNGRMEEKRNLLVNNYLATDWEWYSQIYDPNKKVYFDTSGYNGAAQGLLPREYGETYPGHYLGIRQKIADKYINTFPSKVRFSALIKSDTIFTVNVFMDTLNPSVPDGRIQFVTNGDHLNDWQEISYDSQTEIDNPFAYDRFAIYVKDSTAAIDTLIIDNVKLEIPLILSDDVLRFSSYNGVVRIMGASKPLSYFYVDRTFFPETDSTFTVKGWQLTESEVSAENRGIYIGSENLWFDGKAICDVDAAYTVVYVKLFVVMDDGQYSLLTETYKTLYGNLVGAGLKLCVEPDSLLLRRVTDIGIAYSFGNDLSWADSLDDAALASGWYVGNIVSLTEKPEPVQWAQMVSSTSTSDSLVFYYGAADDGHAVWQNGYLTEGLTLKLQSYFGLYYTPFVIDTVIYDIWGGGSVFAPKPSRYVSVKVDSPAYLDYDANTLVNFEIEPEWLWDVDGGYYYMWVGVEFANGGTDFYDLSGIPAGTKDINPDYSHHVIIGDRAFCLSLEDEEEDVIRYSPSFQWDVFPNLNIMQTGVGTSDRNLAIANVNDRLVVMKKRSLTQGQFNDGQFYQDVGFSKNGLYAMDGWTLVNNDLYFMDEGELFGFNGIAVTGVTAGEGLRERYREKVTADGLLFWNKLNNGLWCVLDGEILVWQPDRGAWYVRDTDVVPSCGWLDFDNRLLLCDSTRVVTFDHDSTTFDEEVGWSFTSRLIDAGSGWDWKKLHEFYLRGKGNVGCDVIMSDGSELNADTVAVALDSAKVTVVRETPNFLFKELEVTVASDSADSSMQATLRELKLRVMQW